MQTHASLANSIKSGEGNLTNLFRGHGLLAGFAELLNGLVVVTQILLATNENNGKALAEVKNFGNPLQKKRWVSGCLIDCVFDRVA